MDAVSATAVHEFRPQLLERRARLQAASGAVSASYLAELITEIDTALGRIDSGSYGLCETCHDPIEPDRLEHDPLLRFCLDHLSAPERQAHEEDLRLAAEIHTKLLPPRDLALPHWEAQYRYEPLSVVGGDYCELIPLPDRESLFFALGDVAGKGIAASLLMTHLSAIFRSLLSLDLSLAEVTARANRLFCESTAPAQYATLVCGRATGDTMDICNAGHCPPLLLQGASTRRMESTGLPLGLFCGSQYQVQQVRLDPGDRLVLYSDGVTEAQDSSGEEYGEARLTRCLLAHSEESVGGMADALLKNVKSFRGMQPANDDLTAVFIRRRG